MKRALVTFTLLFAISGISIGQDSSRLTRVDEYNTFIAKVLSTNGAILKPSFSLDISDKSTLSLAIPIVPFMGTKKGTYDREEGNWRQPAIDGNRHKLYYVFLDGKISASDNFTSLYKQGKWQTQSEVGGAVTWVPFRITRFYSTEVNRNNAGLNPKNLAYIMPIDSMPISKASQVNFFWVNVRSGFSYAKNSLIDSLKDGSNAFLGDTITNDIVKGGYVQTSLNWYIFPSKYKTPRLTVFSQALYKFQGNGTNYDELTKTEGTISSATTNNNITVTQEEDFKSVRKSEYLIKSKNTIFVQAIALINSLDHKFYFGIGGILEWKKLIGAKSTTDVGVSINVPINKTRDGEHGTLANLQLRFIWADISNNYYGNSELLTKAEYRKQNFNVGFTVAVPIVATHYSDRSRVN